MAQLTITTTAAPPVKKLKSMASARLSKIPDNEANNNVKVLPSEPDASSHLAASEAVTGMYLNDSTQQQAEIPLIDQTFPTVIVWKNVLLFIYLHAAAIYGAYLFVTGQVYLLSFIWGVPFYTMNGLGITAGCHRLWCHKSYKAKLPLRILLTFFQTVACQVSVQK